MQIVIERELSFETIFSRNSADIDATRKKMTVLSPMPGKLPSKTAILGVSTTSL